MGAQQKIDEGLPSEENLTDAIRLALREAWPDAFQRRVVPKKGTPPPRTLPPGVYKKRNTCLVAAFSRIVEGHSRFITVMQGDPGDFSDETAQRLSEACAVAMATWDREHGR